MGGQGGSPTDAELGSQACVQVARPTLLWEQWAFSPVCAAWCLLNPSPLPKLPAGPSPAVPHSMELRAV